MTQLSEWSTPENQDFAMLKRVRFPHLTDDEFKFYLACCQERGLSPWLGHLYLELGPGEPGKRDIDVRATIDGLRLIACRTNEYRGRLGPLWCGPDGDWRDVWLEKGHPVAAKVGVLRDGREKPAWGTARWDGYVQYTEGRGEPRVVEIWAKMPDVMLAKCAESLALRAAFPGELGGLYSREEMMQAGGRRRPAAPRAASAGSPPIDRTQLLMELLNMGVKQPAERDRIVSMCFSAFGRHYQDDLEFNAAVLDAVRSNPARYGVNPPMA